MVRRLLLALTLGMLGPVLAPAAMAAGPGDEPATAITVTAGATRGDSTDMTSNPANDPASCGEFEGFSNTMWFATRRPSPGDDRRHQLIRVRGRLDGLPGDLFVYARAATAACPSLAARPIRRQSSSTRRGHHLRDLVGRLDAEDTGDPSCPTTAARST